MIKICHISFLCTCTLLQNEDAFVHSFVEEEDFTDVKQIESNSKT